MLNSVLIANRGEIVLRIARSARRLGLRVIAVHSEADRGALHVTAADDAVEIGPAPSSESYLRQDRIIDAALRMGAECIHPGCGFLAENAEFAERCAAAGVTFVGPSPEAIRTMGEKDRAKLIVESLGLPTVPGYSGETQDDATLAREADRIGYPVLLKAVAGGGGKGLKAVAEPADLDESAASARREAQAAFGNDRLMIEKLIDPARHIEVQVFRDTHGNAVHMFERECTLQRRNQKVIEEAPAIAMPKGLRNRLTETALAAAEAVNYFGAGTVEFLLPGGTLSDDSLFYFMEMNTRLQIEHPVTELVTGLDLVEWQFRIAAGEALPLSQSEIALRGAAVEARLYAEDPASGFLPSPGRIWKASFPEGEGGIRIDSGVTTGSVVPPFYDAMIAKIIGHGDDRGEAYGRLLNALEKTVLAGPKTNLLFLNRLAACSADQKDRLSTKYIDGHLHELTSEADDPSLWGEAFPALLTQEQAAPCSGGDWALHDPWNLADSFELAGPRRIAYRVEANGEPQEVSVLWTATGPSIAAETVPSSGVEIIETDDGVIAWRHMQQCHVRLARCADNNTQQASEALVRAPMFGRLTRLFVQPGDQVAVGDRIAIVEAMKMEHVLHAEAEGIIEELPFAEGEQVDSGAVLAELKVGESNASD